MKGLFPRNVLNSASHSLSIPDYLIFSVCLHSLLTLVSVPQPVSSFPLELSLTSPLSLCIHLSACLPLCLGPQESRQGHGSHAVLLTPTPSALVGFLLSQLPPCLAHLLSTHQP